MEVGIGLNMFCLEWFRVVWFECKKPWMHSCFWVHPWPVELSFFNLVVKPAEVGEPHTVFLVKITREAHVNFTDGIQPCQVFIRQANIQYAKVVLYLAEFGGAYNGNAAEFLLHSPAQGYLPGRSANLIRYGHHFFCNGG